MRRALPLAVVLVALASGCLDRSLTPIPAASPDAASPLAAASYWWNETLVFSTVGSAQVLGVYLKPDATPSNCAYLRLGSMRIVEGRAVARWDDAASGGLVLFTYQRDRLDANVTGRGYSSGPSDLVLGIPPSEEVAREILFVGVEAPDEAPASAGHDLTVEVELALRLKATAPPDPEVLGARCSFDRVD